MKESYLLNNEEFKTIGYNQTNTIGLIFLIKASMTNKLLPIAVDLDGTLLLTDTLHESCIKLLQNHPIKLLFLPVWLLRGKAYLKQKLAELTIINVASLPFNAELVEWLKKQKILGHKIILSTAANIKIANDISNYLNLFDEVIASDGQTNNSGKLKSDALVNRFGKLGFIYVGNSSVDLYVWPNAAKAVVVNSNKSLIDKASKLTELTKIFPRKTVTLKYWLRVLRVHQYLKNLLLFLPIIAAHQLAQINLLFPLIIAFISFSLCASAVYIMNDLIDLESDRKHPSKRNRPFASGVVPIQVGVMLTPILLGASFLLASLVDGHFFSWLGIYFLITVAYSIQLKRLVLFDCLTLATLYTLRIISGGSAIDLKLSFWLLAFSIFLFLSLAFVKRYAELQLHTIHGNKYAYGRGYNVQDSSIIQTLGVSSGYASTLLLALYVNSDSVTNLYSHPEIIWLAIPMMLFWISWVWLKAHRGEMNEDPIIFATKDKTSLLIGLILAITFVLATL
jgi:4-hydroxybenzoate polyprenyltransferase